MSGRLSTVTLKALLSSLGLAYAGVVERITGHIDAVEAELAAAKEETGQVEELLHDAILDRNEAQTELRDERAVTARLRGYLEHALLYLETGDRGLTAYQHGTDRHSVDVEDCWVCEVRAALAATPAATCATCGGDGCLSASR